jgi:hypothetical protein
MPLIGNSLTEFYRSLAMPQVAVEQRIKNFRYPMFQDFGPVFSFRGDYPQMFSFDQHFPSEDSWVELQDGLIFLLPYLFSKAALSRTRTILPAAAVHLLPPEMDSFLYSVPEYRTSPTAVSTEAYVYLDYFETLSSTHGWQHRLEQVRRLATEKDKLTLLINSVLINSHKHEGQEFFYEGLRSLPHNCSIISFADFFKKESLESVEVHFLYDQLIILRTPWEEVSLIKAGLLKVDKISEQDELVATFPVGPLVSRAIYRHRPGKKMQPEALAELRRALALLHSPQDYLNKNYIRLIEGVVLFNSNQV